MAKLAEQAERYDDMAETMRKVATTVAELTADERNLLSEAYKKKISSRRASWKILKSKLEKESNATNANRIREYQKKVKAEMSDICNDIVLIVDRHLIPSYKNEDPMISAFYYKMKGDYCRYLAEFTTDRAKKEAAYLAYKAYEYAEFIARMELPSTHLFRLDLALNYSIFFYEILRSPDRACKIAQNAFNDALSELDLSTLFGGEHKDRDELMQLLCDNVRIWKAEK